MLKNAQDLTVLSPAKVNLHLAVLDRRPDGFHDIESVFLAVDFADTLHFELAGRENSVEIAMEPGSVPDLSSVPAGGSVPSGARGVKGAKWARGTPIPLEKNIIFRALSLFRAKTGFSKGIRVNVRKRIPIGGGLGGGSSNAASTLLALNKLAGSALSPDLLPEMGASLGSDVPFFLHETAAALVTGRGERIEALSPPGLFLTLVNPGFSSDTAAAYRLLDKKREDGKAAPSKSTVKKMEFSSFFNDFLPVFKEPESSVYNEIISRLKDLGAQYANLSGSGSTCFGVFGDRAKALQAAEILRSKWNFSEFCCPFTKLSL
jgi:4-diphosphocytidyl-2-C-methyl-D-erythritol kinase